MRDYVTVSYEFPRQTDQQAEACMRIAAYVMGWKVVTREERTSDDRVHVFLHRSSGCLKGTPYGIDGPTGRYYERSFQTWNPFVDSHAAAELRDCLCTLGWVWMIYVGESNFVHLASRDDLTNAFHVKGSTPEFALAEAADQLAMSLLEKQLRKDHV